MAARGAFNTKLGFVMAAVGSAVGLGNLWRFPYLASTNGGATFLVLYLVLLFVIGIPALMAEMSLGRRTGRNAVDAFGEDGKRKRWEWAGYLAVIAAALLLSYYAVIAGWSVRYLGDSIAHLFGTPPFFGDAEGYFVGISEGPAAVWAHLIFMAVTIAIVARGVSKGIEKSNLIMMPILFLTVIGLVIYGNLQPGAAEGRSFYLDFQPGEIVPSTISNAAGQAFFSIGLGIGTMLTYSSYLSRDADLQRTGTTIALADTGVAFLAGLMVFPLIFSLGLAGLVESTGASSIGGLFIAIPTAFASMNATLGPFMALGFFIMLTFAALSSAISLLEVPVAFVLDRKPEWGRPRAVLLTGLPIYFVGLFSALSINFLGQADALVSRILLVFGGFLLAVYVGWVRKDILDELDVGLTGRSFAPFFRPAIQWWLPFILGLLTILGVLGWLGDIGVLTPDPNSSLGKLIA